MDGAVSGAAGPVVIFDGVCNLCNATVDFLIRRDRRGVLRFTANQHEAGRQLLAGRPELGGGGSDTVYLYHEGRLYERSEAALRIARLLGFPWSMAWGLMLVPRFLRDGVYAWIARNRYRWFGKKETCRLPSPEERARFLP
jgi:predicted DCC family thiol-disulfide oxidoreductase YuxK